MAKLLMYFRLQFKSACKSLPKIIAGTFIFTALIALTAFGIIKAQSNSKAIQPMNIALVLPADGDQYTEFAFSFISEIDSIKSVCSFEKMNKPDAFSKLNNGEVAAVILIPDNFAKHIIDGTNTPADIIFPTSGITSQSSLFKTLVNAGVEDLSAAQAGIYAADDVCKIYSITDGVAHAESVLNKAYFSYALDRSVYFKQQTVSATGDLNIVQFYTSSGILLLLFLSGISCIDLFKKEPAALKVCMQRQGIPQWYQCLSKITSASILYFVLGIAALEITNFIFIDNEFAASIPTCNLRSAGILFCIIFCVFSLIYLIYQIASHQTTGVILLFILSIGMLFSSGNIIPIIFLPKAFTHIAAFMPTTYLSQLCEGLLIGKISSAPVFICIFLSVICIAVASLLSRSKA